MFGIEYMTVGGYLIDGGIVCREDGEKRGLPASASVSVAELEANFADGLTCDDCMEWIVEPAPSEEPEEEEE